jgi:multidrug efflux system outer membrane protein
MNRFRALTVGTLIALGGCNMAPAYVRPAPPVPATLPQGESYPVLPQADGAIDAIGWNTFFTDARLRKVIADALANNRDLRASIANVAVARAQYRGTHAAELPTITAVPRPAAIAAPSRRADM